MRVDLKLIERACYMSHDFVSPTCNAISSPASDVLPLLQATKIAVGAPLR